MPSGKVDQGETLSRGAARELFEETGAEVEPGHLRLVQVVHHKQSESVERIGFREPEKCAREVRELPDDVIEYPREGLLGYLEGSGGLVEHGW
ncbi:NUDIX domain-containing protein [Streptomyces niveus]|uniref:NUDIX domain-containing protein n=1 Tax=Streptomyces niveus TaxID=193462 RepID=UPI0033EA252B